VKYSKVNKVWPLHVGDKYQKKKKKPVKSLWVVICLWILPLFLGFLARKGWCNGQKIILDVMVRLFCGKGNLNLVMMNLPVLLSVVSYISTYIATFLGEMTLLMMMLSVFFWKSLCIEVCYFILPLQKVVLVIALLILIHLSVIQLSASRVFCWNICFRSLWDSKI